MLTSLKNICSNSFGSKAISCVLQPPHLQIPTHRNTEGCLCAAGCYFYPHYGGQSRGQGRTWGVEAFRGGTSDCKRQDTHRELHVNVLMHTMAYTHGHTPFSQDCALTVHEILIGFCPKCLQRTELLMHHYISASRAFHYLSEESQTDRGACYWDAAQS